jgi:tRNA (guanine37-N1)-methyltransferase
MMAENVPVLAPPEAVRGMKALDRALFSQTVSIPCLKVPTANMREVTKAFKRYLLKMPRVKGIADLAKDDPFSSTHKLFMLNPQQIRTASDFSVEDVETLMKFGVDVNDLTFCDLELGYENWSTPEILRAVLPDDSDGVSSFSIIGHIAHLNLKPEVMDYKQLIGKVLFSIFYT